MKQGERCVWLIRELIKEQSQYLDMEIPQTQDEQKRLIPALITAFILMQEYSCALPARS